MIAIVAVVRITRTARFMWISWSPRMSHGIVKAMLPVRQLPNPSQELHSFIGRFSTSSPQPAVAICTAPNLVSESIRKNYPQEMRQHNAPLTPQVSETAWTKRAMRVWVCRRMSVFTFFIRSAIKVQTMPCTIPIKNLLAITCQWLWGSTALLGLF